MSLDLAHEAMNEFCVNPRFRGLNYLCYIFADAAKLKEAFIKFEQDFKTHKAGFNKPDPRSLTPDFLKSLPHAFSYPFTRGEGHILIVGINSPPGNETFGIVRKLLGKPQYILPGPAYK